MQTWISQVSVNEMSGDRVEIVTNDGFNSSSNLLEDLKETCISLSQQNKQLREAVVLLGNQNKEIDGTLKNLTELSTHTSKEVGQHAVVLKELTTNQQKLMQSMDEDKER